MPPAQPDSTVHAVRRLPQGAELQPEGGVHFRTWAPDHRRVELVIEDGQAIALAPDGDGYHAALVRHAGPGTLYRYRLGDDATLYPDPATRYQPRGVHGPSEVIDPTYPWTDAGWPGVTRAGAVLYELHVGTFTAAGTFAAVIDHLAALKDVGITCLELMPVADFAGGFGWGYDGVDLYAPSRLYGRPDDLRRLVDQAHGHGIGVILDVVYNHFGPDGCYCGRFAKAYFTDRYDNEWGDALNFDGPDSEPVRAFILANAAYWVEEFHIDGLRLDATQQIFDAGRPHIVGEIARTVRAAAGQRTAIVVAENEPQESALLHPTAEGGMGLDLLWNDDLHHTGIVALTGRREAYYTDYLGSPQELISAAKHGYLYQGQHYAWQRKRRGTPAFGLPGAAFVSYLQNHDQVANTARGWRIDRLTDPGRLRALTAFFLLIPATPLLFQGQEFAASAPFLYFADHHPQLSGAVRRGRSQFLAQFPSIATPDIRNGLADPGDRATFAACKLDHGERTRHAGWAALHGDLLRLRREDAVIRRQDAGRLDGAVLASNCLCLRFFGDEGDDRLLIVNLGLDRHLVPAPEPLLAPPLRRGWQILWSSEHPRYGGLGQPPVETDDGWHLTGQAAVLFGPATAAAAEPAAEQDPGPQPDR